jgi:hypothetical protein
MLIVTLPTMRHVGSTYTKNLVHGHITTLHTRHMCTGESIYCACTVACQDGISGFVSLKILICVTRGLL